jgi:hypothetical protein
LKAQGSGIISYPSLLALGVEDLDALTYFGISMFWRAAVTSWRYLGKDITCRMPPRFQEWMRLFLLNRRPLHGAGLIVAIAAESRHAVTDLVIIPVCTGEVSNEKDEYLIYQFYARGILYKLVIGDLIPISLRTWFTSEPPYPIYLYPMLNDAFIGNALGTLRTWGRTRSLDATVRHLRSRP